MTSPQTTPQPIDPDGYLQMPDGADLLEAYKASKDGTTPTLENVATLPPRPQLEIPVVPSTVSYDPDADVR